MEGAISDCVSRQHHAVAQVHLGFNIYTSAYRAYAIAEHPLNLVAAWRFGDAVVEILALVVQVGRSHHRILCEVR